MFGLHVNRAIFWIDGRFYFKQGWFGCQLISFEFKRVRAGTRRTLPIDLSDKSFEFEVFTTGDRKLCNLFMVETSWCLVGLNKLTIDEASAKIRSLYTTLGKMS